MTDVVRMNPDKKATIWTLWKSGYPMSNIARSVNKPPATVFSFLRYHGGIQPRQRCRSSVALTLAEREEISRGIAADQSLRSIARELNRSPSTISREINRNGGAVRYRASEADLAAWKRAKRPKTCILAQHQKLHRLVTVKRSDNWSPEQISGWLKLTYPHDQSFRVSHETIYKSLFIQTRGLFRKELRNHLCTKRKFRHARNHKVGSRGQIVDGICISERPPQIEDRALPGPWEGDLIKGTSNSHIATVVERQTRFTVLVKVNSKSSQSVVTSLSKQMGLLPDLLKQSLTWDQGLELTTHAQFTFETKIDVYFCDPGSPWQRGTNKNTIGLLRQYFPKGTSLSVYSQSQLNKIAVQLNNRPRKTLGFQTPADKLNEVLQ